jgi:hypothetical protein
MESNSIFFQFSRGELFERVLNCKKVQLLEKQESRPDTKKQNLQGIETLGGFSLKTPR